ncbi:unnamed protein product [Mytilus coruscus]|uniref:Uncharacterized protein n=1 Tax=Mytilus coruscus TaxID=42192 RepID=A0A6J8BDN7_MYTCO|nr:unnamed protein product [Mytilus coruscus]
MDKNNISSNQIHDTPTASDMDSDDQTLSKFLVNDKTNDQPKLTGDTPPYCISPSNINDMNNNMKQKIEINKEHVPEVNDVKCVNNDDSGNKIVSFDNKSETRGFQEIMSRMETSFSHALEKITTQHANLFETKLSSIDKMYSKSLESHNEKFNMLMKKFEEMTTRGVTETLRKQNS